VELSKALLCPKIEKDVLGIISTSIQYPSKKYDWQQKLQGLQEYPILDELMCE
jgi:hypothetical protein